MGKKNPLNIDENVRILLNSYPLFGENIHRYHHAKQGETVRLTIPNNSVPRFSLSVTMYEFDGVYVDFGDMSIIEQEISVDKIVLDATSEVLNDKCIVVLGYQNEKAYVEMKSYFGASYFDSDEEEDNSMDEYQLFMRKMVSPIKGLKKFFKIYKGIIEASNWSGSEYTKIYR